MSTRITLWYSDAFHLYQDGLDDKNVYLEVTTPAFDALVLKIPLVEWKEMRKHTIEPAERYLDLSDEELLSEAEREVDEHTARIEAEPDHRLKGFFGMLTFGGPDESRDEMIANFLRSYRPSMLPEASQEGAP